MWIASPRATTDLPGSAAHLFHRFFDVLVARRLTDVEVEEVNRWLSPPLASLFFSQPAADQRHGYEAARLVLGTDTTREDVVMAALTHDVAKRLARLGVTGRTFASLLIKAGLPLGQRMSAYRDHGLWGARELRGAGAPPLVIDFAEHHHGERPRSISADDWDLLVSADQPPKAWASLRRWITSSRR